MKRITQRITLFLSLLIPLTASADDLRQITSTSQCVGVFVSNNSVTTGAGLTGLVYNSGSLICAYYIPATGVTATGCGTAGSTSLNDMALGTYTSGGFKQISSANMPGWYEFCPPNTALASGNEVDFELSGAANMAPVNLRIILTDPASVWNYSDTQLAACTADGSVSKGNQMRWLYQRFRNKLTDSGSVQTMLKDDASTGLCTNAVSDSASTYNKGEFN
jgi:hypothetical protein